MCRYFTLSEAPFSRFPLESNEGKKISMLRHGERKPLPQPKALISKCVPTKLSTRIKFGARGQQDKQRIQKIFLSKNNRCGDWTNRKKRQRRPFLVFEINEAKMDSVNFQRPSLIHYRWISVYRVHNQIFCVNSKLLKNSLDKYRVSSFAGEPAPTELIRGGGNQNSQSNFSTKLETKGITIEGYS